MIGVPSVTVPAEPPKMAISALALFHCTSAKPTGSHQLDVIRLSHVPVPPPLDEPVRNGSQKRFAPLAVEAVPSESADAAIIAIEPARMDLWAHAAFCFFCGRISERMWRFI